MKTVITGANRGIGLELTRQLLLRGDTVHAGARVPEEATELKALAACYPRGLRVNACDVALEASVVAFAEAVGFQPIDLLINNAGLGGQGNGLGSLDFDHITRCFQVNALGALRMVAALLPVLKADGGATVLNITSRLGSIGSNDSGGAYGYRMSKAALNMATRSLALDLAADHIFVVAAHPGWVQTDMGGPQAPLSVADSAKALLGLIKTFTAKDSGCFFNYDGDSISW